MEKRTKNCPTFSRPHSRNLLLAGGAGRSGCRDGPPIETPTREEALKKINSRFPAIVAPLADNGTGQHPSQLGDDAAHAQSTEDREGGTEATRPREEVTLDWTSQR